MKSLKFVGGDSAGELKSVSVRALLEDEVDAAEKRKAIFPLPLLDEILKRLGVVLDV